MEPITGYIHGYSEREAVRLRDQANTVRDLLHHDTYYPEGSRVLEAGCGVGAQTITLARNSPDAEIVSIDISSSSIERARALVEGEGLSNVQFQQANIFELPFQEGSFDHVFVCYVLEHLEKPVEGLMRLNSLLKRDGSITVIEGDHGSCYFHPETPEAVMAWNCLIKVQASLNNDSLIGRRLFPLLNQAGFRKIWVSPRMVYMDRSKPDLMDGFVLKTIVPMVEGVKGDAIDSGLIDGKSWQKGVEDLKGIAQSEDGVFCYTFFKATAFK